MKKTTSIALAAALTGPLALGACESLPGSEREQGAVIGGVGGAVAGAALGDSALATILGGALGAGGGYLIGTQLEKRNDDARGAVETARTDPATVEDVRNSDDADLNDDGFVTMDEVVAMAQYGLNQNEMLARLERTGQVFELTREQERALVDAGVSPTVVTEMQALNPELRQQAGLDSSEVIGRDPQG